MNIEQSKTISTVDFLHSIGYKTKRVIGPKHNFLSPIREEHDASFYVDTRTNRWVDFGTGAKGDLLDLIQIRFNLASTREALRWLEQNYRGAVSMSSTQNYQPQAAQTPHVESKQILYKVFPLTRLPLLEYMNKRGITSKVASHYCKEIRYINESDQREYYGVGFPNRSESYEVRSHSYKRCVGYKDISYARVNKETSTPTTECCVFEGFMDFLSYIEFYLQKHSLVQKEICDCIVLNSVATIHKALPLLDCYSVIHCYLDNDDAGKRTTEEIRKEYPDSTIDESFRYAPMNDVNDYLMSVRGLKKEITPSNNM